MHTTIETQATSKSKERDAAIQIVVKGEGGSEAARSSVDRPANC